MDKADTLPVTVVIPTRNRGDSIVKTVETISSMITPILNCALWTRARMT